MVANVCNINIQEVKVGHHSRSDLTYTHTKYQASQDYVGRPCLKTTTKSQVCFFIVNRKFQQEISV